MAGCDPFLYQSGDSSSKACALLGLESYVLWSRCVSPYQSMVPNAPGVVVVFPLVYTNAYPLLGALPGEVAVVGD
jgi:hypothetical protein